MEGHYLGICLLGVITPCWLVLTGNQRQKRHRFESFAPWIQSSIHLLSLCVPSFNLLRNLNSQESLGKTTMVALRSLFRSSVFGFLEKFLEFLVVAVCIALFVACSKTEACASLI